MLSEQEELVWEDILRHWSEEVEEPPHPADGSADTPLAVMIGARVAIVLLLFGAVMAALAVAVATGVIWFLARHRP